MTAPTPPARPTLTLSKPAQAKTQARSPAPRNAATKPAAGKNTRQNADGFGKPRAPGQPASDAVRGNTVRMDAATPSRAAQRQSPAAAPTRAGTPQPAQRTRPAAARQAPQSAGQDNAALGVRLNKYLADKQYCSRREADHWIEQGWVTINGKPVEMGQRVQEGDRVSVAAAAHDNQAQRATIVLHKPVGYVSGQAEDGHQPALVLLTEQNHWRQDLSQRKAPRSLMGFAPAGRLDIDSTGILILTQDGRMARHIIGELSEVEKEYLVRVSYAAPNGNTVSLDVQDHFPAEKLELLRHGLSLDGAALKPAEVDWQNPEQLRFVLREGKKRQIRRMCEQVGLHVTGLKRIRIGQLMLGHLPAGQWRFLGEHESI